MGYMLTLEESRTQVYTLSLFPLLLAFSSIHAPMLQDEATHIQGEPLGFAYP